MAGYPIRSATYTTAVAQPGFNLDPMAEPFGATITVILLGAATATYGIQYALDDPFTVSDNNANWLFSTQLPSGQTASAGMTFYGPVSRVRINIAAITGSVLMQVAQGVR